MRSPSVGALARDLVLTAAAAEAAVRLLRPRPVPRPAAPADLRLYFSAQELERGRRFARPQLALGTAGGALQLSLLALAALRPPGALRLLEKRRVNSLLASAGVAAGLAVGTQLPSLPFAALARRRSLKAGLATQSWRGWGGDLVKATALEAGFAAAAGVVVVAARRRFPHNWWLLTAGGSVGVGAVLAGLGPVLLDPIFNDFEPLAGGQTRADVLALAAAARIRVDDVFVVDASRRTTAANAYVTGLGPTKRVVLFDTLLDRYDADEVRGVVAHELAHVRHRDVLRGIGFAAAIAVPAARAIARLGRALSPAEGAAALPALSLAAAVISAPLGAIAARLSRAIERRADQYSLELTEAPAAFVSFERRIALQNLIDIDPPRLLQGLLASHPVTAERIGAALEFARRTGAPTPLPPSPGPHTPAGS